MCAQKWVDPKPSAELPVVANDGEILDAESSDEMAALSGHGEEHLEIRAAHPEDPVLEEDAPPDPDNLAAQALADETETTLPRDQDVAAEEDLRLIRNKP